MAENYGLRIKNKNGFVQIDGEYSNLALVEKLTLRATTQDGGPQGGAYYTTRSFPGYVNPVIAIYSPVTAVSFQGQISNGVWQFTFWAASTSNFEVYAFDNADRGTMFDINYGLVVKNKVTNTVVFDSRKKYMRVIDVLSGSPLQFSLINKSYDVSEKIAVVQGSLHAYSFHEIIPDDPVNPMAIASIQVSSIHNLNPKQLQLNTQSLYENANRLNQNPVPEWYNQYYSYIVLDVSNFD